MRSPHEKNLLKSRRVEDLVAKGGNWSRDRLPLAPVIPVDGGSTTSTQPECLWERTTQSRVWSCLLAVDGHEQ